MMDNQQKKLPKRLQYIMDKIHDINQNPENKLSELEKSERDEFIYVIKSFCSRMADNKEAVLKRMLNENKSEMIDFIDFTLMHNIYSPKSYLVFDFVWFESYHRNLDNISPQSKELYDKMKNSLFFRQYSIDKDFDFTFNLAVYPSAWKESFMSNAHKIFIILSGINSNYNPLQFAAIMSKITNEDLKIFLESLSSGRVGWLDEEICQRLFQCVIERFEGDELTNTLLLMNNGHFTKAFFEYFQKIYQSSEDINILPFKICQESNIQDVMLNNKNIKVEDILNNLTRRLGGELDYDYYFDKVISKLFSLHSNGQLGINDVKNLSIENQIKITKRCYEKHYASTIIQQIFINNLQNEDMLKKLTINKEELALNFSTINSKLLDFIFNTPEIIKVLPHFNQNSLEKIARYTSSQNIDEKFDLLKTFLTNINLFAGFECLVEAQNVTEYYHGFKEESYKEPIHNKNELYQLFANRLLHEKPEHIKEFLENEIIGRGGFGYANSVIQTMLTTFNDKLTAQYIEMFLENKDAKSYYNEMYAINSLLYIFPNALVESQKERLLDYVLNQVNDSVPGLAYSTVYYINKSGENQDLAKKIIEKSHPALNKYLEETEALKLISEINKTVDGGFISF